MVLSAGVVVASAVTLGGRQFADAGFSIATGIDAYPSVIGTQFEVNQAGVAVYQIPGGAPVLHPVNAAQRGIGELNIYLQSRDPTALEQARSAADALIEDGVYRDGALYFPYRFDIAVGIGSMRSPWYSGMAQGQALSLLVRLTQVTGDDRYLQAAQAVVGTFELDRSGPQTVHVDAEGYYWVDEYVMDPPDPVLNGFIFALFGLYDDWSATGDERALRYFRAGATTVLYNVHRYRDAGHLSWYDLDHRQRAKPGYHDVHVTQLLLLAQMTGDTRFTEWSALLQGDAPH